MTNSKSKKELLAQFNQREIIGGVYAIKNTENNKMLLAAATDMQGSKNRFEFAQKTGSCIEMKLQSDWNKHGGAQFVFEVLEELKKGEAQTAEEFKADVNLLKQMWLEKLTDTDLY